MSSVSIVCESALYPPVWKARGLTAQVLNGVLAPILVVYLIIVGNNRKIMRGQPMSWITNLGIVLTAIVMFAAATLLFYGLATGHGG